MRLFSLNWLILFLFISGACLSLFSQNDTTGTGALNRDSVSISRIIQSQIDSIKSKEIAADVKKVKTSLNEPPVEAEEKDIFLGLSEDVLIKVFLLMDACFAAALFIMWRRRKQRIEKEQKVIFKDNIRKLREERIKGKEDVRLKALRKNLQTHAICANLNDNAVANQAKKLSISKGEIYLAAKIKSYNKDENA